MSQREKAGFNAPVFAVEAGDELVVIPSAGRGPTRHPCHMI